jgi:hypothetical protein
MNLPDQFCWTRFGAEAGEAAGEILRRKEKERAANGGVFLWGIGNGIGPSLRQLLEIEGAPEVIFSPILGAPREHDVSPALIVRWGAGRGLSGERFELPAGSLVTSGTRDSSRIRKRFALVCHSEDSLQFGFHGRMRLSHLRNFLTGAKVGSSQVTAVVRYDVEKQAEGAAYTVALRTALVRPYLIELIEPSIQLPGGNSIAA